MWDVFLLNLELLPNYTPCAEIPKMLARVPNILVILVEGRHLFLLDCMFIDLGIERRSHR
jgi:hypothetical protein